MPRGTLPFRRFLGAGRDRTAQSVRRDRRPTSALACRAPSRGPPRAIRDAIGNRHRSIRSTVMTRGPTADDCTPRSMFARRARGRVGGRVGRCPTARAALSTLRVSLVRPSVDHSTRGVMRCRRQVRSRDRARRRRIVRPQPLHRKGGRHRVAPDLERGLDAPNPPTSELDPRRVLTLSTPQMLRHPRTDAHRCRKLPRPGGCRAKRRVCDRSDR